MTKNVQNILSAVIASAVSVTLFCGALHQYSKRHLDTTPITIGVICNGDKSTPYTANFARAAEQMEKTGANVDIFYNTPYESTDEIITQLADDGADLIFTNSYDYGAYALRAAEKYPDIQFCCATCDNADPSVPNYHTFMGEISQGFYLCGVAAGVKLKEMIDNGTITQEQAVVGFVAAYPQAETISGYTAFLLGVRSQCPTAVMRVKYIQTWSNFALEKSAAEELIGSDCVMIAHDTDTIGSAIACENADMPYPVFHIGYNQDMISAAPTTELIGTCIDWAPYMEAAAAAVQQHKNIESTISGKVFSNDAAGGLVDGWVRMFDLNTAIAAPGTDELLEETISEIAHGRLHIFQGNYTGVDPENPDDTCDLNKAYEENASGSSPTFHYVLNDIITIEE